MTKIQPLSNSKIPSVQQFGYHAGASSASQSAHLAQVALNHQQNKLNMEHSGGGNTSLRVVVPQSPTHGMQDIGPTSGNSNATQAAGTLTQSFANSQFDNMVGKGGSRKSRKNRRYRRRKPTKKRKPKKRSRKRRTKHHRKHKKGKSRRR